MIKEHIKTSKEVFLFPEGEVELVVNFSTNNLMIVIEEDMENIPKFKTALERIELL